MPFLPFLFIVALQIAVVAALTGTAIRLAARICGIKEVGWGRSMALGAAILLLGLVEIWVTAARPEHELAVGFWLLALAVFGLAAAMRAAGKVGWRRAALCSILAMVLASALSLAAGLATRASGAIDWYRITSDPMAPAVVAGDGVIVDRMSGVRRWDVVAYRERSGEIYMHRIAGLPGETIEIVGGRITIDGAAAPAPPRLEAIRWDATAHPRGIRNAGAGQPVTLGADEYFVVGDNAEFSYDSRLWEAPAPGSSSPGAIRKRDIIGIARIRYAPIGRVGAVR